MTTRWKTLVTGAAADLLAVIERHAQRVVYLSASGVDVDAENQASPIHQFHPELERAMQRADLDRVFLRPASFARHNLAWAEQIRDGVVHAAGADQARALIHETDIAAVAVRALTSDDLLGTRPELAGPESLTTAEQALAIGAALGRPVRFEAITPRVARAQADGYPADLVEAPFDHTGQFTSQPATDAVYEITGRVPRSIRQRALDHAEAFR